MISASDARKQTEEAIITRDNFTESLVKNWMNEKDIDKMIDDASKLGYYRIVINTKRCPDTEILKNIIKSAGYYIVSFNPVGNSLVISWEPRVNTKNGSSMLEYDNTRFTF